jgi:hypothetical protein
MTMLRTASLSAWTALALLTVGATAHAGIVTYGFENLSVGQTTPILNAAPDSGGISFRTDFTSSPAAGAFSVFDFVNGFQPAFSGHFFSSTGGSLNTLTLTFNQLVDGLSLNFAMDVDITDPAGSFQVATPFQLLSVASADVGGDEVQGGSLSFAGATPFNSVQLTASNNSGNPIAFTIDNLVITTTVVPEPATLLLAAPVAIAGLGLMILRRWRA